MREWSEVLIHVRRGESSSSRFRLPSTAATGTRSPGMSRTARRPTRGRRELREETGLEVEGSRPLGEFAYVREDWKRNPACASTSRRSSLTSSPAGARR